MRFVSQNHGVAKKNGIYHGFGTSEDCTDAVSQPFLAYALSVWRLKLSTKVFGNIRVAKANLRKLSVCALPMSATHFLNLGSC